MPRALNVNTTYQVECWQGCRYTIDSGSEFAPKKCGSCGCPILRVWKMVADGITDHIHNTTCTCAGYDRGEPAGTKETCPRHGLKVGA